MFSILVIDDDKNIRYMMREVLETEGYSVLSASGSDEAFDIIESSHVDLVIVDIMMPGVDGYGFTEQLRGFNREIPILMVSAKHEAADRKRGFLLGIDDYMSKPIDNEELILHVKALLRRVGTASERKITVGDVTLDYDSFTVNVGGESVVLPQKEFQLLFKLLSFPGKIFTRIQLMDEIWGVDCDTDPDTVTVHIARLRRRFEGCTDFEIVAMRGLGYKAVRK